MPRLQTYFAVQREYRMYLDQVQRKIDGAAMLKKAGMEDGVNADHGEEVSRSVRPEKGAGW